MSDRTLPCFSLLAPPYREFLPFIPEEGFPDRPEVAWGAALVWCMGAGMGRRESLAARRRAAGVPLLLLLPPATELRRRREHILEAVEDARPLAILPHHPRPAVDEMTRLLRPGPEPPTTELVEYLRWRGIVLDRETRRIVLRLVELSAGTTSIAAAARGVYLSRRALGRRFRDRGLPVPSHWLQFARVLRAAVALQSSSASVFDVARALGYPDGFTLSNQMDRLVGVRPSFVRERLGWEWLVEAWLLRERNTGGLTVPLTEGGPRERIQERRNRVAVPPEGSAGLPAAPERERAERKHEPGGAAA